MTVTAMLSVSPAKQGSMAPEVADAVDALEEFDVEYETTSIGTVLESESAAEVFAAAEAAHAAVDSDRVTTLLKVDDERSTSEAGSHKVESVEEVLGRRASSSR